MRTKFTISESIGVVVIGLLYLIYLALKGIRKVKVMKSNFTAK